MADPTRKNYLRDTTKPFGDITGSYTELVDLGKEYLFRGLMIYSSLNQEISLRFDNPESDDLVIPANWGFSPEIEFWHDSVIEIKYTGAPPTAGSFKIVSWRAE